MDEALVGVFCFWPAAEFGKCVASDEKGVPEEGAWIACDRFDKGIDGTCGIAFA